VSTIVAEPNAKWRAARALSFDSTVVVGTARQSMAGRQADCLALHHYLSPILLERFSCADG
jgi:hypothetical protein